MGIYEYVLLAGAAAALVFGFLKVPRAIAYVVFLLVAAWPCYTMGVDKGFGFATIVVLMAVIFIVYAALYWVAGRFSRRGA